MAIERLARAAKDIRGWTHKKGRAIGEWAYKRENTKLAYKGMANLLAIPGRAFLPGYNPGSIVEILDRRERMIKMGPEGRAQLVGQYTSRLNKARKADHPAIRSVKVAELSAAMAKDGFFVEAIQSANTIEIIPIRINLMDGIDRMMKEIEMEDSEISETYKQAKVPQERPADWNYWADGVPGSLHRTKD